MDRYLTGWKVNVTFVITGVEIDLDISCQYKREKMNQLVLVDKTYKVFSC